MITLKNISNVELISRTEKLVRTERKITHLILQYILEIEDRKLYAEMGYDGMYTYLTRGLGYSEASAYRRLQSAKLLKRVPGLSKKVVDGQLNLSQLTQVQKCLKEQNQKTGDILSSQETMQVLEKIQNKNTFETERILAWEFNQPVQVHEKIKPQKDNSVRIEVTLTQEQFVELEQAKSLLSHICPDGSWSGIITTLAKIYNKKKLKGHAPRSTTSTQRVTAKTSKNSLKSDYPSASASALSPAATSPLLSLRTSTFRQQRPRKYISVKTKRSILEKAQYCCEYIDQSSNKRCSSRYQLELDHIKTWSLGGSNEPKNLRVLCKKHNNLMAVKAGFKIPRQIKNKRPSSEGLLKNSYQPGKRLRRLLFRAGAFVPLLSS